jgi:ATP-dependent exoDNAse (exonuclease V) beta subunit
LDRNFSVVASAGSGKTRAITERILELARSGSGRESLPQLVVVTYTNRAADEMQQRTRQGILEARLPPEVIEAFNRAFFGTIHSFCMKLLAVHGHHLGLPANLELINDDADLWNQFVQQYTTIGRSLGEENRRVLLRHVQVRDLMELARKCETEVNAIPPDWPCPDASFTEVSQFRAKGSSKKTIPGDLENLRRWEERWRQTGEFVPWPPRSSNAKDFVGLWREAFQPLRAWVSALALCVVAEVHRAYREFRFERGRVTYADQVALAGELMRQPDVVRRIRHNNYRVILDEAQDTDPPQFLVLIEVTRPTDATGIWRETRQTPPRPGRFCMVGDFQQSIYRTPSDLARYRELHEQLVTEGAAEELTFSVTFRLDQAPLDFINATFPAILDNADGQMRFVPLNARPEILSGQIIRLDLKSEVDLTNRELLRANLEALELAEWLRDCGLSKLRAASWREVAILAPRKAWLRSMRDALLAVGLHAEVHSESELRAENPAYAWLTALLTIMADPNASYEIVGVLREVFGLSDDELARFSQGVGARFQIAERTSGHGPVPETLNLLARLRLTTTQQPLFSAAQEIVRMTHLRERLRSLPPETFPELTSELDRLLSAAAAAEANRVSLADFARNLRSNYSAVRETNPSTSNAIQLITAHKAKGSEWQAVIVPFFTRKVWVASPRYPMLRKAGQREEPQIVFDKTDADELEDELKAATRQEMERLLYVALTRAKHTLVLAVDRDFFPKEKGFHSDSLFKWLAADRGEPNELHLASLPTNLSACTQTARRQQMTPQVGTRENFGSRETGWIDRARQNANRFIHTVVPSNLGLNEKDDSVEHESWTEMEPEIRPVRVDNPATRYGIWWHGLAQRIPWLCEASVWDKTFAALHNSSPDVTRSTREWRLLRARVNALSDFANDWSECKLMIHAEMPFCWKMTADQSLEGLIDLALFDSASNEWLIIDWKTNRVAPNQLSILRQEYRAQLAAYRQVVRELTGQKVSAALYSTATGEFVRYESAELKSEWERLEALPPEDLFNAVSEITVGRERNL